MWHRIIRRFGRASGTPRSLSDRRAIAPASPVLETLEARTLLSSTLLGIDPDLPTITFNSTTGMNYDAVAQNLSIAATPTNIRMDASTLGLFFSGAVQLSASIDNAGNLIGGSLLVTGDVDVDGDFIVDHSGTLLTATVIDFGAEDTGSTVDVFDFRLNQAGGALAGYYAGKDLGLRVVAERSNFIGTFTTDFTGGAKGELGSVEPEYVPTPGIDVEKYVQTVTYPDPTPTPTGGEGKTPGYWRQPQHFDDWVYYSPGDNYNEVFGVNDDPSLTLLDAVKRGGGGLKALGRHAVAALLNAASAGVDYLYTNQQIIAMVQAAYNGGDVNGTKNLFEAQNELEADLSDGGVSSTPDTIVGPADPILGPMLDADDAPGVIAQGGDDLIFTYVVTNTGDIALENVTLIDDDATADTTDDFAPAAVLGDTGYNVGDLDADGLLDVGEEWLFTATITVDADACGTFTNIATVTGTPSGYAELGPVSDSDPANYTVECDPVIPPPPPPPVTPTGTEGLTPGFWKQSQHFEYWLNYETGDSFDAVFGVDGYKNLSLLDALKIGGGGEKAFMRHAVAALLNAQRSDLDYLYSTEQVISMVQAAYASGDFDYYKSLFESENEKGGDIK